MRPWESAGIHGLRLLFLPGLLSAGKPGEPRMLNRFASFFLACSLSVLAGCALSGPQVVDDKDYAQMIRRFPKVMQEKGFADSQLHYTAALKFGSGHYGEVLHNRLSPDFLYTEQKPGQDVYLGDTFHETLTPMSHEYMDKDGAGFRIVHPSQKVSVRMLAVLDWNGDGKDDWLVLCRVENYRGSLTRDYYLLLPDPDSVRGMLHAVVAATAESRGAGLTPVTSLRNTDAFGKKDAEMPQTKVKELEPGRETVTEPPSSKHPEGGVQERNI